MPLPKRRWPQIDELLAWWLHLSLDDCLPTTQTPDRILKVIEDFKKRSPVEVHQTLQSEYEDFKSQFLEVEYP